MPSPDTPLQVKPTAPSWFTEALADAPEDRTVEVDGCPVHYLRWGDTSAPGVVLVHGGAAHAHWWSFLAPIIAEHYHVVAIDLSGHGDSGHREAYPRDAWAIEPLAVAEDAGMIGAPVLVGHSMGGLVSIVCASVYGDKLAGAIIVDSPVREEDPESRERGRRQELRPQRVYPDLDAALARFRLMPDQPCENDFIMDYIGRASLKQVEGGWQWKFDPRVFVRSSTTPMSEYLASVQCRVALMRGEFSIVVPPETGEYMYEVLDRNAPLVEIPHAHHHLILDQPLAFIAALRALLADWEHSVPRRRRA